MTTTVIKSIGTAGGRDYTTLQAWEDAAPADLVTADQIWRGEVYNDSTFTAALVVSGSTSDSTRYKELTAAAGHSFIDTPTNPLRFGTSYGAHISYAVGYNTAVKLTEKNSRMSRMQVRSTNTNERSLDTYGFQGTVYVDKCLFEGASGPNGFSNSVVLNQYGVITNSVIIKTHTSSSASALTLDHGTAVNNTIINSSGSGLGTGLSQWYSGTGCTARNNAIFGFATVADNIGGTHQTNATDLTSPGAGWTGLIAFTTATFANVSTNTWDWKTVSGSALLNAGTTDTTNAATDIFGTARPAGASYDIGAYEYASVSLPTLGYAVGDTSTGAWTPSAGGTLYGVIDETTPSDADYISVASLSTCEVLLNETAFPGGAIQTLSYRASSSSGSGLTVTLKQGATTIASWSHGLTATDTLYVQTLTSGQIAAITAGALSVSLTST